jgi:hypothetical protein
VYRRGLREAIERFSMLLSVRGSRRSPRLVDGFLQAGRRVAEDVVQVGSLDLERSSLNEGRQAQQYCAQRASGLAPRIPPVN